MYPLLYVLLVLEFPGTNELIAHFDVNHSGFSLLASKRVVNGDGKTAEGLLKCCQKCATMNNLCASISYKFHDDSCQILSEFGSADEPDEALIFVKLAPTSSGTKRTSSRQGMTPSDHSEVIVPLGSRFFSVSESQPKASPSMEPLITLNFLQQNSSEQVSLSYTPSNFSSGKSNQTTVPQHLPTTSLEFSKQATQFTDMPFPPAFNRSQSWTSPQPDVQATTHLFLSPTDSSSHETTQLLLQSPTPSMTAQTLSATPVTPLLAAASSAPTWSGTDERTSSRHGMTSPPNGNASWTTPAQSLSSLPPHGMSFSTPSDHSEVIIPLGSRFFSVPESQPKASPSMEPLTTLNFLQQNSSEQASLSSDTPSNFSSGKSNQPSVSQHLLTTSLAFSEQATQFTDMPFPPAFNRSQSWTSPQPDVQATTHLFSSPTDSSSQETTQLLLQPPTPSMPAQTPSTPLLTPLLTAANPVCGGRLWVEGNITSPGFPAFYPDDANCTWTLKASRDFTVGLDFTYFNLEQGHDFLYIYFGTRPSPAYLFKRYTGAGLPASIQVWRETAIVFSSDSSVHFGGFNIKFFSVKRVCGNSLSGSGNLTSPNYPSAYPRYANCTWNLAASLGSVILLEFLFFDVEKGFDILYVYNSSTVDNRFLSGTYTGAAIFPAIVLQRQATVVFMSDHSVEQSGFSIRFSSVVSGSEPGQLPIAPTMDSATFSAPSVNLAASACGGRLSVEGNITSPNYPSSYPINANCTWILKASHDFTLKIDILFLDLENGYDFLYIYFGARPDSSSLYKSYTGNVLPVSIQVAEETAIVFSCDDSGQRSGFVIRFRSIQAVCGESLSAGGNLTSPRYPAAYPSYANCTWNLNASAGSATLLEFLFFDVEKGIDVLYVYNSSIVDNRFLYGTYTGTDLFPAIVLPQHVTVTFISDYSVQQFGFILRFSSVVSGSKTTQVIPASTSINAVFPATP